MRVTGDLVSRLSVVDTCLVHDSRVSLSSLVEVLRSLVEVVKSPLGISKEPKRS